ncbi:ABC-type transport auxiliary lipoprotein family protein [Marinobacter sp.]|uniref:ABC-type transport auxiliary lipoprotein family protein n=1 Tax=Marinobacter sp. TaxID=50741 RepID=UPI003A94768B
MKLAVIGNLTLLLGIFVVSGCTVFPNPEPPRVMDLALPATTHQAVQESPLSLRVDTPYASEPFNSTRILAKPTPWEFRAYDNVRWRDTVPVVIRDSLVEALRNSNAFAGVISDTSPADAELTLVSELTAFHAENPESAPQIVIALHMQLIHNRSRASVCSNNFRIVEPVPGTGIEEIIEGFSAAGGKLASSVIEWAKACDLPSHPERGQPRQP